MNNIQENWQIFVQDIIENDPTMDIGSLQLQKTLNPVVWESEHSIKQEIADRLYEIAKAFMQNLNIEVVRIHDVTFTGSLANFNWSNYSDIDLHVIISFPDIDENVDLVREYMSIAAREWNNKHKITIKGYEVEIYVQDVSEPHYSTGIYSIKNSRWVRRPSKMDVKVDQRNIEKKTSAFMSDVDEVYELFSNKYYEKALKLADNLKYRIRKFRKSGLERSGSFSVENLTFKLLRRNDYLKKLSSLRILSYDKMMSMNGKH